MKLHVKRVELKYEISQQEMVLLRSRLDKVMKKDNHSIHGAYLIRSLYFDNKSNRSFFDKEGGIDERQKYRLRIYDFNRELIKFEIKHKLNDMIWKDGTTIKREDCEAVMRGEYDPLLQYNDRTLNRVYYEFKRDYYQPVVVVEYRREAYLLSYNNIRVTFDTRLKKSGNVQSFFDPDLVTVPVLQDFYVIMEIKYDHFFPRWLDKVLEGFRYLRCANSKYCLARLI